MKVLSLGWGRQSFTLAVMAALGDIEKPDVCIHADTTHESVLTYRFAEKWTPWLEARGLRVVTVQPDPKKLVSVEKYTSVRIPAYVQGEILATEVVDYDEDDEPIEGKARWIKTGGVLNRQCTGDWKISPMRRWIQANRGGEPVVQIIGISYDEFQRMKDSDVKYITHSYPLIDAKMTVADCLKYLTQRKMEIPPRSACVFCPFHNQNEWRRIQKTPEDWIRAVTRDESIRRARWDDAIRRYYLFVHPSRKPLASLDFRNMEDRGQINLWNNECEGLCGV